MTPLFLKLPGDDGMLIILLKQKLGVVPPAEYSSDFPQIFKCHFSGCTRQTFTSTMSARGSGQGNTQCERPPGRVEDKHLQNITNLLLLVKSELGKMDFTK